jgi:ATP synthase subunit 6
MKNMGMICSPFEQFQIQYLYKTESFYITDTLLISAVIVILLQLLYMLIGVKGNQYNINIVGVVLKGIYSFIYDIVYEYLNEEGKKYFPFFNYLFIFIVVSNIIGILPYSFTITSHLSITFSLAFMIWYGMFIGVGVNKYGLKIFSMFFPKDIPFALVPLLVFIETISFIFRSISLALRLFANIVAGHILLDTIAVVVHKLVYPAYYVSGKTILIGMMPIVITIVLILFECVVAMLQGYIFVVLCCIYLKDMIVLH